MDAELIKLLAQDEVNRANESEFEWPSLFSNNMVPFQKNIDIAIEYLNSLTKDELELRLSILNWQDSAMGTYRYLVDSSSILLRRTIEARDWGKLEIDNIKVLLEKGIDELMTPCDYFPCPNEFPSLYKNILTGNWTNFLFFEELKLSAHSRLENQIAKLLKWKWNAPNEDKNKFLAALRENWEYMPYSERVRRIKSAPIKLYDGTMSYEETIQCLTAALSILDEKSNEEERYERNKATQDEHEIYYNKTWLLARDIQALIWYKNYLLKIRENGVDFSDENEYISDYEDVEVPTPKIDEVMGLRRINDGYTAIVSSYELYKSTHDRSPKVYELMKFMADFPPQGFNVRGSYRGSKITELTIEGVENPIDREAFGKRFKRYFKKTIS